MAFLLAQTIAASNVEDGDGEKERRHEHEKNVQHVCFSEPFRGPSNLEIEV